MSKYLFIFFIFPCWAWSQTTSTGMVWTELGVKGGITKKLDWSAELTSRFGNLGVNTFFPQVSLKYKVTKWFKPSVEYRFIGNKDVYGNYLYSHRINVNGDFKHTISKFEIGLRARYQFTIGGSFSNASYNPEFDQAIRIKPSITYDIKKSIISPTASVEFFYDPKYSQYGQRFTKIRSFVGVKMDWKKPYDISIGYLYDTKINLPNASMRHVLSMSFAYNIENKKK
jgi:hypothetical protein